MKLSRASIGVGVAFLLSLLFAPAAQAHAAYESSEPDNGSTVSSPPSQVIANFTEPLVEGSRLDVYDPCGDKVDNGDSIVAGDQITVLMSADKQGRYTVRFDVVSAVDSHPTNGDFSFTSSGGAPCAGAAGGEEQGPSQQPQSGSGGGGGGGGTSSSDGSATSSSGSSEGSEASSSQARRAGSKKQSSEQISSAAGGGKRGAAALHRQRARVPNIQPLAASGAAEPGSVLTGIPGATFAMGLVLAALIGAAGGKIYAGIMGWTRSRTASSHGRN